MKIDVREEGKVTVVRLSGDLDTTNGPRLTEEVYEVERRDEDRGGA